jgi:hypothetical protein
MRILFCGQAYYRKDNGQAVFMIRLAEGLVRAGHDVMALAPAEQGNAQRVLINGVIVQTVAALHIGHNLNLTAFVDGTSRRRWMSFAQTLSICKIIFFSRVPCCSMGGNGGCGW